MVGSTVAVGWKMAELGGVGAGSRDLETMILMSMGGGLCLSPV